MKINGELFKLIRISRDISQADIASILNIKQPIVSDIENTGECSQELLYKISQVLRYTPKFFLKEPLVKDTNLILYRKKLTIPKKLLNSIDARLDIFLNYQLFCFYISMRFESSTRISQRNRSHPRKCL